MHKEDLYMHKAVEDAVRQSMKTGIRIDLSGNTILKKEDINKLTKGQNKKKIMIHPDVGMSRAKSITYSNPAILTMPYDGFSKAVQPINDDYILATVHIDINYAWILMNMLNISKFKTMPQRNNGLYEEIYKDIFKNDGKDKEINELKELWAILCDGGTKSALDRVSKKNSYTINTDKVNDYFKKNSEIKNWKRVCHKKADNHDHIIITPFGTKIFANYKHSIDLRKQIMSLSVQGTGSDVFVRSIYHYIEDAKNRGLSNDISLYFCVYNDVVLNISKTLLKKQDIKQIESRLIKMFSCNLLPGWISSRINVTFKP